VSELLIYLFSLSLLLGKQVDRTLKSKHLNHCDCPQLWIKK